MSGENFDGYIAVDARNYSLNLRASEKDLSRPRVRMPDTFTLRQKRSGPFDCRAQDDNPVERA
jgi:hypothetical protein